MSGENSTSKTLFSKSTCYESMSRVRRVSALPLRSRFDCTGVGEALSFFDLKLHLIFRHARESVCRAADTEMATIRCLAQLRDRDAVT